MLSIRDNVPLGQLKSWNLLSNTEALFIGTNLRKKKLLMCCGYSTIKHLINELACDIAKELGSHIANYDNFLWR